MSIDELLRLSSLLLPAVVMWLLRVHLREIERDKQRVVRRQTDVLTLRAGETVVGVMELTPGRLSFSPVVRPRGHTMPSKEEALLSILRTLQSKRVEEVADRILALFNAPQRWKPADQQEIYRVSDCGEIQASTFRHGEHRSEALWAFGNCFKTREDAAHAREAIEQLLINFHIQQT